MLNDLFSGLFDTDATNVISVKNFILCIAVSLALGMLLALASTFRARDKKSLTLAIALLPAVVTVVIMLVNGNIGAGVAVAGAFSLVRFRSAPGSAKEIVSIFIAMGVGLIAGMGYLAYAALFTFIMAALMLLLNNSRFGENNRVTLDRTLKITVPEDLNLTDAFDDAFEQYTSYFRRTKIKTANMGSLFKLTYDLTLKNADAEKALIDALRTRNGNLEIQLTEKADAHNEL
ncbi:MAG: DUF4956 domain-containing protein [Clostridia bacterium]|nr:DUF4956 domain-containing protein [Clostridia bacterium]MBR0510785.1 DUF4956 domain-containing protein [Clostridia bacterium]MBR0537988.1 DUF4956 domain-containing protein [Clostridia bacterium]